MFGKLIGKINWVDTAQNLIIVIVSVSIGAAVGYKASTWANEATLAQVIPTIEKAIDKETIKNEIKNEIDIDKIKNSDSLNIVFSPDNNQKPTNVIKTDTDCIKLSDFTQSQQKRIKRWQEQN